VSDLYDQTNPQAVEIDRLRRCLAEVEAQLRASIRDCREKARLLAHTKARLAELEAENEDHRLRIGILQNALRGADTG
jgi:septal ring factor EnvC (AmiA/AmiB activator)